MKRPPGWAPTFMELMVMVLLRTLLANGLLLLGGCTLGYLLGGSRSALGAGIGILAAGGAMMLTTLVMMATEKITGMSEVGAMLGSYLLKMMALLILLAVLAGMDFYSKTALTLGFIAAIVLTLAVETVVVARSRG